MVSKAASFFSHKSDVRLHALLALSFCWEGCRYSDRFAFKCELKFLLQLLILLFFCGCSVLLAAQVCHEEVILWPCLFGVINTLCQTFYYFTKRVFYTFSLFSISNQHIHMLSLYTHRPTDLPTFSLLMTFQRSYMHTHTYSYTHIIHTYTHKYIHIHILDIIHTYTHKYTHMHIPIYTYTHTYTCASLSLDIFSFAWSALGGGASIFILNTLIKVFIPQKCVWFFFRTAMHFWNKSLTM